MYHGTFQRYEILVHCCWLNAEILSLRGRHRIPATLGLPGTSLLTWGRQPRIAHNADRIANSQHTPPVLHPQNSGSSSPDWFLLKLIFSRLCDSRNLNLSPFCNLSASSLAKWQPAINSTYGDSITNYTSGVPGPLILKYPKMSWAEQELLVSLTEVFIPNVCFHHQ